jgi:hypothetical protein
MMRSTHIIEAPNVHAGGMLAIRFLDYALLGHTNTAHHRHNPSSCVIVEHGCSLPSTSPVPVRVFCVFLVT